MNDTAALGLFFFALGIGTLVGLGVGWLAWRHYPAARQDDIDAEWIRAQEAMRRSW